jgi:hypothetical protein
MVITGLSVQFFSTALLSDFQKIDVVDAPKERPSLFFENMHYRGGAFCAKYDDTPHVFPVFAEKYISGRVSHFKDQSPGAFYSGNVERAFLPLDKQEERTALGSYIGLANILNLEIYRPPKTPKRQMNLEHCLNKHLSGTIDPKIEVEPICRTNPTMKGKVIIQDRETATTNATQASMIPGNIFTDGSRLETGEVGCAAVWLTNNGTWKKHQYHLGKKKEINDAELFAIAEALKMANRYQIGDREMDTLHIYTDSMSAL